jgi:hypothetical protein
MDNWDASVVYQVAIIEHQVRVSRGEAAQRLAALLGRPSLRARLAAALVTLATRLDTTVPHPHATSAILTPAA